MKRMFSTYPEVVLADTTHGTNQNRYIFFSFVVHGAFGKVRVITRDSVNTI
ncbi:hypothetical protein JG688_00016227 [Phytophthora aleatoria]|uniref:ZSWIM1/3 RNaseH-like domain-containing protein n=1 Tax=Phytophthora aleatoria TaxID=2496075 RepID=A0A8J5IEH7_9STRA|nr:hypothetical protein JG688_00016227 [Phytophthora aleatoria]